MPRKASPQRKTPRSQPVLAGWSTGPHRILTTHVGSLIRPPELRQFLTAQRDKQPYDETAFAACLHDLVADVVRKQAEIGLDIINDGEYGKTISWSRYVLERMSGFEQRDRPAHAGMPLAVAGRDRREFTEFYADYDRHQGFTGGRVGGDRPYRYTGQAALQRDIANSRRRQGVKDARFMAVVAPGSVAAATATCIRQERRIHIRDRRRAAR